MKTFHRIYAILYALLAGWCIQLAGKAPGIWQILVYAEVVFWTGFCFVHIFESFKEDK